MMPCSLARAVTQELLAVLASFSVPAHMLSRGGGEHRSTEGRDSIYKAATPSAGRSRILAVVLPLLLQLGWGCSHSIHRVPASSTGARGRCAGAGMALSLLRGNPCGRRVLFLSRTVVRPIYPSSSSSSSSSPSSSSLSTLYPTCVAVARRRKSTDASPSPPTLAEDELGASSPSPLPPLPVSPVSPTPDLVSGCGSDEDLDLSHLARGKQLHKYWLRRLSMLRRPSARNLVAQLVPDNALGFEAGPTLTQRRGTLFDYVLSQKKAHPDKVILTRVGEFYETYGVDALMMIEYAGLNPMGNRAKAGCPVRNIQATLDGLTGAGLTVAVVEEVNELDGLTTKFKIKARVLSQVVSPGSSTYLYDCCLRPDDVEFKENRPYVGLLRAPLGYMVVEVFLDQRVMRVTERLTAEAVRAALEASGLAEPIYVQGVESDLLRAVLPSSDLERRDMAGHNTQSFPQALLHSLSLDLEWDVSDMRILQTVTTNRPRPMYLNTAQQIGVLPNPNVPDLIKGAILPANHAAHSARFWRRWLLAPPPYHLADAMQNLCVGLSQLKTGVPQCRPIPVGKLVSMLSLRQCNVPLFRDLEACLQAMHTVLTHPAYSSLVVPLMSVVAYESGIDMPTPTLSHKAQSALDEIASVVYSQGHGDEDEVSVDPQGLVPQVFFERNEEIFRSCVRRGSHPMVDQAYADVQAAMESLVSAVHADFPVDCEIVVDHINNALMLKKKPASPPPAYPPNPAPAAKKARKPRGSPPAPPVIQGYITPTDRNHKPIAKRYTTQRVEAAVARYLSAVSSATAAVRGALQDLSARLKDDLPVLVTSLHVAVVLQAACAHVAAARYRGWTVPTLLPPDAAHWQMQVDQLTPYWMDRSRGVGNSFTLRGLFLLTAPNMSGKSTLMRAVTVTALLANCGLLVPCASATVPRFDNYFVRTASYDVPSEGKSAFALEMDDVRVMLRDCSAKSLVMLDEIGKGTSARDGAALSGALLEAMDGIPVTGIFATHLHEMFDLPLHTTNVVPKRMGHTVRGDGHSAWTYRLEDGRCTSSLAMQTARDYGIPLRIIERAEELGSVFDRVCRPSATLSPNLDDVASRLLAMVNEGRRNTPSSPLPGLLARGDVVTIDGTQDPPPGVEGTACLYVLQVTRTVGDTHWLYVGETESVRKRMAQHRKKVRVHSAIVLALGDKSEARSVEASLIRDLTRAGYPLLSQQDGLRANPL